jgi:hypothetical protein
MSFHKVGKKINGFVEGPYEGYIWKTRTQASGILAKNDVTHAIKAQAEKHILQI